MKKRYRKKRKERLRVEGLERGNAYLLEAMNRLMDKLQTAQAGLEQVQRMYEAYLMAAIDRCGGEMIFVPDVLTELPAKKMIRTRVEENGDIVIAVMEREQA